MATLNVIDKYPPGKRIDHENFGEVCKTTFSKGVITDFEKVQDDPIQVKPQVKVKVDGQVSGWLPLFYHPKALYWDGDGVLATDFDTETGAFRQAWQSFRADDEVAVMLKEGAPVAVLGFADGVPRIGEDIIQFETVSPFWWQMSKQQQYASEDGPDGVPLKLELKAELIADIKDKDTISAQRTTHLAETFSLHSTSVAIDYHGFFEQREGTETTYQYSAESSWTTQNLIYNNKCQIHLVKVGPILYLVVALFMGNFHTKDEVGHFSGAPGYDGWSSMCSVYDSNTWPYGMGPPPALPFHYNDCNGPEGNRTAEAEAYVASMNHDYDYEPPFDLSDYEPVDVSFHIYAAVYSEKLYNDTKDNPPGYDFEKYKLIPDPPSGFIFQAQEDVTINAEPHKINSKDGMKYHVRPHTQAELQAAGMWPAEV